MNCSVCSEDATKGYTVPKPFTAKARDKPKRMCDRCYEFHLPRDTRELPPLCVTVLAGRTSVMSNK